MVIKSLTITEEAYNALKALKHGDESFSEVILRTSKDKIGAAAKFFGALKLPSEEVDEWKRNIKNSRKKFDEELEQRKRKIARSLS